MMMMRSMAFILLAGAVVCAQEKPGQIVIAPKQPTAPAIAASVTTIYKGTDPDRPGFVVIFPNLKAMANNKPLSNSPRTTMLPAPTPTPTTVIDAADGVPTITIVGTPEPKANKPMATPLPAPLPVQAGVKPAAPGSPAVEKVEDGKLLVDTYDVAYCRNCKVGHLHTVVRQYIRNEKVVVYGLRKLTLQFARFGQPVELWTEESTVEDEQGQVLSTRMRQGLGKNQVQELAGEVTDKGLVVSILQDKNTQEQTIPWPSGVVGIGRETTLIKDMKPKPGLAVEYQTYFGQFNGLITYKYQVKGIEDVVLDAGKPRKLLRVVQEMKPVGDFRLPPATYYLDPETYEPVAMESDMPLLGGLLTARRTTREIALAKPTKLLDIGEVQSIALPNVVNGLHTAARATYQFNFTGDIDPAKAFSSDSSGRQVLRVIDAATRTVELTVTAQRTPVKPDAPLLAPMPEYLGESYFIDWNNPLVKKHAAAATANLPANATAWEKAQAVERWVRDNMKQVEYSQAMASCSTAAKELSGDCTEHAMLAMGMCRAVGIPSRSALGLVYYQKNADAAILAYHMWAEVWTDGGWLAIDPIMGLGSVGPGHLKITDSHWDGEKGFTPILPVMNVVNARPTVKAVK